MFRNHRKYLMTRPRLGLTGCSKFEGAWVLWARETPQLMQRVQTVLWKILPQGTGVSLFLAQLAS